MRCPSGASAGFAPALIPIASIVTTRIATSDAGSARVSLGSSQMIPIVSAISASMIHSAGPRRKTRSPAAPIVLKLPNCAIRITMASPLTNPSITEWGTIRMNIPSRAKPAPIWMTPQRTTVGNRYSMPWTATSDTMITAIAPVAPEIIPGRPPTSAAMRQRKNAEYRPMTGDTPATKANATASGTSARATVRPDRESSLRLRWRRRKKIEHSGSGGSGGRAVTSRRAGA